MIRVRGGIDVNFFSALVPGRLHFGRFDLGWRVELQAADHACERLGIERDAQDRPKDVAVRVRFKVLSSDVTESCSHALRVTCRAFSERLVAAEDLSGCPVPYGF